MCTSDIYQAYPAQEGHLAVVLHHELTTSSQETTMPDHYRYGSKVCVRKLASGYARQRRHYILNTSQCSRFSERILTTKAGADVTGCLRYGGANFKDKSILLHHL